MVIWVIGLAGSGKTTVATMLCDAFWAVKKPVVLSMGIMLEVFGNDLGFTEGDRLSNEAGLKDMLPT